MAGQSYREGDRHLRHLKLSRSALPSLHRHMAANGDRAAGVWKLLTQLLRTARRCACMQQFSFPTAELSCVLQQFCSVLQRRKPTSSWKAELCYWAMERKRCVKRTTVENKGAQARPWLPESRSSRDIKGPTKAEMGLLSKLQPEAFIRRGSARMDCLPH